MSAWKERVGEKGEEDERREDGSYPSARIQTDIFFSVYGLCKLANVVMWATTVSSHADDYGY